MRTKITPRVNIIAKAMGLMAMNDVIVRKTMMVIWMLS